MSSLKALGTVAVLVATAVGTWALARATVEPAVTPAVVPAPMAVPVERRILETAVIDRASVRYANPVTVPLLSVGDSVVTWSAATDSTVETGDVLVELSGRPAFVLEGATPMYRRLERGVAGRDVIQFQEAMTALGLRDDPPSGEFDLADEHAAAALYFGAGFVPDSASTPGEAATLLDRWRSLSGGLLECPEPCDSQIAEVRDRLVELYGATRVGLPAAEVVFVEDLPRRVGSVPEPGSQPTVELTAEMLVAEVTMAATRAGLLEVGMEATVDLGDGTQQTTGQISDIRPGSGEQAGLTVVSIALDEAMEELVGQVVRTRIPLTTSEGPVLAVPLTALAAGGDGTTFVTVLDKDGSTHRVGVTPGLVADGYVEVDPTDGDLSDGEYVIVGERGG